MRTSRFTVATSSPCAALVVASLAVSCAGGDALPPGCTLFLPDDSGCHRHERELLTTAWREVSAKVCAAPPDFVSCLSRGTFSPVERADIETITSALRRPGWTTLRCADLAPGRDAEASGSDDGAVIRVDHGYLAGGKARRPLVETLAHELSHTLGYAHYGASGDALGEYGWSVPVRFEACVSPLPALDGARDVALAPLGILSETLERDEARWCPAGTTASGVAVADSAGATRALALSCRGETSAANVVLPVLDAVTAQTLGCGRDVLVGARASVTERGVVVRQALCLPLASLMSSTDAGLTAVPRVTGPGAVERRCPPGSAVRGLEATSTQGLRRLTVWCDSLDRARQAATWSEGVRIGARAHPPVTSRTWRCDRDGAVVGLFGALAERGNGIVRLGARCRTPAASTTGAALRDASEERALPALGAASSDADHPLHTRCEGGRVAIGVRARSTLDGAIPLRVGVLCGAADGSLAPTWSDDGNAAATVGAESRCPVGSVVAGLTLETTWITATPTPVLRVSTLRPHCRARPVSR